MRRGGESRTGGRGIGKTRANYGKMYAVEDVIAVKYVFRRFVWLVKWKGYPSPTWIPTRNFAPKSYWREKMEELKHTLSKGGSTRASSFESSPSTLSEACPGGLNVKDVLDIKEKEDGRQYCEVELEGVAGPLWIDIEDLSFCDPSIMRKVGKLKDAYDSRHHKEEEDDDATTASVIMSDSGSTWDASRKRPHGAEPEDIVAFRKKNGVEEWLLKWGNSCQGWRSREFVEKFGSQFNKKMDELKSEEEIYTVEDVLGFKVQRTGEEYFRVKWVGYAASTWEPGKNLVGVTDQTLLDKMQRLRERRGKLGAAGLAVKCRTPRKSGPPRKHAAGDVKSRRRPPRLRRDSHGFPRSA